MGDVDAGGEVVVEVGGIAESIVAGVLACVVACVEVNMLRYSSMFYGSDAGNICGVVGSVW